MVDLIATEYEAKCSALIVVVNAQADAQWDVADSRGWLKRISKLDAAE